jgi:transcriptional regulator with XRE-family HTH domain
MKRFADRLREARVASGLTQEQLGFALGVTKSSVSAWENGRETPNFRLLPQLRTILKRSLDELICGVAPNTKAIAGGRGADDDTSIAARDARERTLLQRYRALPARLRDAVLEIMRPASERGVE